MCPEEEAARWREERMQMSEAGIYLVCSRDSKEMERGGPGMCSCTVTCSPSKKLRHAQKCTYTHASQRQAPIILKYIPVL